MRSSVQISNEIAQYRAKLSQYAALKEKISSLSGANLRIYYEMNKAAANIEKGLKIIDEVNNKGADGGKFLSTATSIFEISKSLEKIKAQIDIEISKINTKITDLNVELKRALAFEEDQRKREKMGNKRLEAYDKYTPPSKAPTVNKGSSRRID